MRRAEVVAAAAAAVGFMLLLVLVTAPWAPLVALDTTLSEAFRDLGRASPGWVTVLRAATNAAGTVPYLVVGLVTAAALAVRGERHRAVATVTVVLAVLLLWTVMHGVVHRPRPAGGFVYVAAYGFPSGHTANAATLAVLAVWLLWSRLARTGRVVVVVAAATFAGLVGLTRVALLAHWPTDVLGAWLLVLAVFPALAWVTRRIPEAGRRPG